MSSLNPYLDGRNSDYDFRSMLEDFQARPLKPQIERKNSFQRLKKRVYSKIPLSPELLATNYGDVSGDLQSHRHIPYSPDQPLDYWTLTPPQSFSSHTENSSYSAKRRKTNRKSIPLPPPDVDDKRHELVMQMQLLRTSLEDEEALEWTSSEDESGDDSNSEIPPVFTRHLRRQRS